MSNDRATARRDSSASIQGSNANAMRCEQIEVARLRATACLEAPETELDTGCFEARRPAWAMPTAE